MEENNAVAGLVEIDYGIAVVLKYHHLSILMLKFYLLIILHMKDIYMATIK